jgi:hypothetical protein
MKRCPTCHRVYPDNSQDICPYDGTPVVFEAPQQQPYYGGGQQSPTYGAPGYPPPPQSGWAPPPPQGYGYPPMGEYPPLGYAPGSGRGTGLSKAALFTGIGAIGSFLLAVVLVMGAFRGGGYSLFMVAGILSWLALLSALTAIILGIITLANANKNPAINRVHGILGLCFGGLTLLIWLFGLASRGRF